MALASGTTQIEIISQAYSLIGAPRPVLDITDGRVTSNDPQAAAVAALYTTYLLDELSGRQKWSFTLTISELNQLSTPPIDGTFTFAYQLPVGLLDVIRVYPRGTFRNDGGFYDFKRYREQIWTDLAEPVFMEYTVQIDEESFPAYFVTFFTEYLASKIALPIAQNERLAEFWEKRSERARIKARLQDSQSTPNNKVQANDIFAAHAAL